MSEEEDVLLDSDNQVLAAINLILSYKLKKPPGVWSMVDLTEFIRQTYLAHKVAINWKPYLLEIGKLAVGCIEERGLFNPAKMTRLLRDKHEVYGPKPIFKWGMLGILMKLDAKIDRYDNLLNGAHNEFETETDTLMDIIGYCCLGLILIVFMQHQKPKIIIPKPGQIRLES